MDMVVSSICVRLDSIAWKLTCLLVSDIAKWPKYSSRATNFVLRLPRNESYIEADTYRVDGIDYINSIAR